MKYPVLYSLIVCSLLTGTAFAQRFEVALSVSDNSNTADVTIGVHPGGTDGVDNGLDQLAPPPPPPGTFDVRSIIDGEEFLVDIRDNVVAQKEYEIEYRAETGQGSIVLTWNSSRLPKLGTFEIVDAINGTLFGPLDMATTNTLDVSSAGGVLDDKLLIRVTPITPVTRYVATTGSDTGNDCTNQANPCATIDHAAGLANNDDTLALVTGVYNEPGLVIDERLNVQGQGIIVQ